MVVSLETTLFWLGIMAGLFCLIAAWSASPMRQDGSLAHWDAQQRHVRDGSVVVYWRPGSWGCLRLRSGLGPAREQIIWVNVWADDEASAFVRDLNGGAEVVPTAILRNGDALTHPSPDALRADLENVGG